MHLRSGIRKKVKELFPELFFRVVFKSGRNLGSWFKYKDSISDDLRSQLIYKYTCPTCNAGYIGCTTRHFRTRIHEHLGVSARTGAPTSTSTPLSCVAQHIKSHKHVGTVENFEIIHNPSQKSLLKIAETILIQREQPELNDRTGSYPLRVHPNSLGLEEHLTNSIPRNRKNKQPSQNPPRFSQRPTRNNPPIGLASA